MHNYVGEAGKVKATLCCDIHDKATYKLNANHHHTTHRRVAD